MGTTSEKFLRKTYLRNRKPYGIDFLMAMPQPKKPRLSSLLLWIKASNVTEILLADSRGPQAEGLPLESKAEVQEGQNIEKNEKFSFKAKSQIYGKPLPVHYRPTWN